MKSKKKQHNISRSTWSKTSIFFLCPWWINTPVFFFLLLSTHTHTQLVSNHEFFFIFFLWFWSFKSWFKVHVYILNFKFHSIFRYCLPFLFSCFTWPLKNFTIQWRKKKKWSHSNDEKMKWKNIGHHHDQKFFFPFSKMFKNRNLIFFQLKLKKNWDFIFLFSPVFLNETKCSTHIHTHTHVDLIFISYFSKI